MDIYYIYYKKNLFNQLYNEITLIFWINLTVKPWQSTIRRLNRLRSLFGDKILPENVK